MNGLVLSLFPGIGLLDMAFEEEGFCVVRGPDLLWGGDVRRFHPPAGRFDAVIGGPPCKRWSRLAHMVVANGYELAPDLIPEFVRVVAEAQPEWFLMENVPAAPIPHLPGYGVQTQLVNNRWVGGIQNRSRRFSFGHRSIGTRIHIAGDALEPAVWEHAATSHSNPVPVKMLRGGKTKSTAGRRARTFAEQCRVQELPDGFDLPGFTNAAKFEAVGNGVPLPMGRAVARAVKAALVAAEKEK